MLLHRHPHRARKRYSGQSRTRSRDHSGKDRDLIVDNFGLPARALQSGVRRRFDSRYQRWCHPGAAQEEYKPTADYVKKLREVLPAAEDVFISGQLDIVTQILISDYQRKSTFGRWATTGTIFRLQRSCVNALPRFPASSMRLQQEIDSPAFYARSTGPEPRSSANTELTVATNSNVSLSSSEQVSPNFWTVRPRDSRIIWRCRRRNTGSIL